MTREELRHITDLCFTVPSAIRRFGEERTYHAEEIAEAKRIVMNMLEQEPKTDRRTNGEVFLALFNPYKICTHKYMVHIYMTEEDFMQEEYQMNFDILWWHAPYQGGESEG